MNKKRVLIVMSSNDNFGISGMQTGTWFHEVAAPYYLLSGAGFEVVLGSVKGGKAPIDLLSLKAPFTTDYTERFLKDSIAMFALENTRCIKDLNFATFDAILFPGGYGLLWDLASDQYTINLIKEANEHKKLIGFICHAPAILRDVRKADGTHLVKGLKVAGFTNEEDKELNFVQHLLFSLEDDLKLRGANYVKTPNWQPNVILDGNIITGQNPASAEPLTKQMIELLK